MKRRKTKKPKTKKKIKQLINTIFKVNIDGSIKQVPYEEFQNRSKKK